eukprot:TRINITY_DN10568_c0_g1_i2.p1 TRINITY_DN10568_c0_g1~~TRINITY_DN10568_c0_g1_i2.p1  ORF type:complete len:190 (-),score=43.21 TRINITY_DN10568_c0_g1_i2:34-543(-)
MCIRDRNDGFELRDTLLDNLTKVALTNHTKNCMCKLILIVDDNDYNLFTIKRKLTRRGYEVITAYNGQQCIQKITKFEEEGKKCCNECRGIRLIFMDVDMPIMNGIEATIALQHLMKTKEIDEVTIVGCSAFESKQDIDEALKAGMKDYLAKPVPVSYTHLTLPTIYSV